jgi:putative inorganic carbon (hco3(-)) transporter
MGFVFSIVYIVLTIVSPGQFGSEWASYHALLYLAAFTALASLPSILSQPHLKSSIQTHLLIGFIVAIGSSQVANHWYGGAIQSWLAFLPSAAVYFFIVANVTTIRRLKIVTLAAIASCMVLVGEALYGYYGGFLGDTFVVKANYERDEVLEQILRLRGVGFLNDPNDFAQILLIALPLLFIAWRQGRIISNSLFVLAPAAVLLWATYLTHSRGGLMGLAVLGLVAARKKLGTTASVALACVLAIGMLALGFTGGRGISASDGADRLELWATGLELFKSAPIFGVGFGNFTNFADNTAHNSLVLPLAELGLVGATLWLALLVTTTRGLNRLIAKRERPAAGDGPKDVSDVPPAEDETERVSDSAFDADRAAPFEHRTQHQTEDQTIDDSGHDLPPEGDLVEVARMDEQSSIGSAEYGSHGASTEALPFSAGWLPTEETVSGGDVKAQIEIDSVYERIVPDNWLELMRLALISFMSTCWFLSRTYSTTTYLVLGLATAAIALDGPAAETRDRSRWMPVTLAVEAVGIVFVYLVVRLRH